MLSIRFKRIGRKKMPIYRIVVMEKHKDPWANYKEKLGFYNPRTKETELKKDRIKYWLSVGAQASDTVYNLLVKNNIIDGKKRKAVKISKKRKSKIAEEKAETTKNEDQIKDENLKETAEAKKEEIENKDNEEKAETTKNEDQIKDENLKETAEAKKEEIENKDNEEKAETK